MINVICRHNVNCTTDFCADCGEGNLGLFWEDLAKDLTDPEFVHEFRETLAEIRRYHKDFTKISTILDEVDSNSKTAKKTCKEIRNIVG